MHSSMWYTTFIQKKNHVMVPSLLLGILRFSTAPTDTDIFYCDNRSSTSNQFQETLSNKKEGCSIEAKKQDCTTVCLQHVSVHTYSDSVIQNQFYKTLSYIFFNLLPK